MEILNTYFPEKATLDESITEFTHPRAYLDLIKHPLMEKAKDYLVKRTDPLTTSEDECVMLLWILKTEREVIARLRRVYHIEKTPIVFSDVTR